MTKRRVKITRRAIVDAATRAGDASILSSGILRVFLHFFISDCLFVIVFSV